MSKTLEKKREQNRIRQARYRAKNKSGLNDLSPTSIIPDSVQRDLLSPVTAITRNVNRKIDANFRDYEFNIRGLGITAVGGGLGYYFVKKHTTKPSVKDYLLGMGVGAGVGLALDAFFFSPLLQSLEQTVVQNENQNVVYLSDMENTTLRGVPVSKEISELIGSTIIPVQSSLVVYGTAGHGKSHFATKLASMFSGLGKTLYLSSEEGVYQPLLARFRRYNASHVGFVQVSTKHDVMRVVEQQKPNFVVLDSLTNLGLGESDAVEFARWIKSQVNASVIVLHATKNANYRGQTSLIHNATIEFSVTDGVVSVGKNRVGESGRTLNLFDNQTQSKIISMPLQATA